MKERPILFSAPMVRALLAGTKTQTRREMFPPAGARFIRCESRAGQVHAAFYGGDIRGRYGVPGDRLYVREAFWDRRDREPQRHDLNAIHYDADLDRSDAVVRSAWAEHSRCRPSIHMPRWASRITLEITAVRAERLHEISEADAIAEGLIRSGDGWRGGVDLPWCASPIGAYRALWESINGAGSWDANPWAWVVEFGRVDA